jgi:SAM-dependent methyltransferase
METLAPYLGARARILDVGSGTGIFLKLAADAGHVIEGIEPNKGYAQWAQRELGLDITIAHWEKIDLPANAYDLIVSHHVLEHLRSPMKALQQFYTWSAANGLLYVSVPNIGDRDASPYNRFHRAHLFGFTPATLIMMARKAGFALAEDQDAETTTLIFRRLDQPPADWFCYPNHAAELAAFFSDNTLLKYLLRPKAYKRLIEHIKAGFDERRGLAAPADGKTGRETNR